MVLPIRLSFFAALLFLSNLAVSAFAATSNDYYQAGLSLYNQKNYLQAVQYFSAAVQLDSNNAAALQGRANCYYAQGNYSAALADYQKVLAQNPNNAQLSQFVQALQAKVGAAPTSPAAPPLPGASAGDPFAQGVALYGQKQYQTAIPYFQQAARLDPNNGKPNYYQGICEVMTGDNRDGALDLSLSNRKEPSPGLANYVNQLMARLSPDDQQWVNGQLAAAQSASAGSKSSGAMGISKKFGIRLEPDFSLITMADLQAETAAGLAYGKFLQQNSDPSTSYNASVPSGFVNIAFEPVYELGPELEVGLPVIYSNAGSAGETLTSGGVTTINSITITAICIGLDARYFFVQDPLRVYVGGGPMIALGSASVSSTLANSGGAGTGMAFGGEIQLGADYKLDPSISIGPWLGYRLLTFSSFSGTSGGQSGELYIAQNLSSGSTNWPIITGGAANLTSQYSRPLQVDLSGLFFGLQVAVML